MEMTEMIQTEDLKRLIETKQIAQLRELFDKHNVVDIDRKSVV